MPSPKTNTDINETIISPSQKELLNKALNSENKAKLRSLVKKIHIADLALYFSSQNYEKKSSFVKLVSTHINPEFIVKLSDSIRAEFIELIGIKKAAKLISKLDSDDAVSILEDLDIDIRNDILEIISKTIKPEIEDSLNYPEDSAGRIMHRDFIVAPKYWNVGEVKKFCHKNKASLSDNHYVIFIVDHLYRPIGMLPLNQLIFNDNNTPIKDLIKTNHILVNCTLDKSEITLLFHKYGLLAAPVIDNDGRMIGVITVDDMIDVINETAQDDILHLGGIFESDIYTKFLKTAKQRLPWLVINLFTAIIASFVIAVFDETINSLVALAVLMPIIASMGGNAGTQTVTIAIRALATKELNRQNIKQIITKEILLGFLNGTVFGLFSFVAIMIIYQNILLAFLFSIAIIITLVIAASSGIIIPLIIYKMKKDPAISSSIILTTITDVVAFFAFLGLATLLIT